MASKDSPLPGVRVRFESPLEAYEFWEDKSAFFELRGYRLHHRRPSEEEMIAHAELRARLDAHWRIPEEEDDRVDLLSRVYATRVADGLAVCIKRVGTLSEEILFLQRVHSGVHRLEPANHCVPLLESFPDEKSRTMAYIVMPALHPVGPETFKTVGDVVEFTSQVLLGLHFIHRSLTAHRDCSLHNIVASRKQSFNVCARGGTEEMGLSPVKYYFVGFGGVTKYRPEDRHSVCDLYSRDREPPEFSAQRAVRYYDPLLLDIFLMGNMFRREFYDKYSNVDFLQLLFRHMLSNAPEKRKDSLHALRVWFSILPTISAWERQQPLRRRHGSWQAMLPMAHAISRLRQAANK